MNEHVIRILAVDDEEVIVFALREYFTNRGFHIATASTLEEAKAILATQRFDVIIADLRLTPSEKSSGLALAKTVAADSPNTHMIILTAYGTAEVESEARRYGIRTVLHKPQPLAAIEKVVRRLLAESNP